MLALKGGIPRSVKPSEHATAAPLEGPPRQEFAAHARRDDDHGAAQQKMTCLPAR